MSEFAEEELSPAVDGFAPVSRVTDSLSKATGLLVVDISNLAYRAAFAHADLKTAAGRFSGHIHGSTRLLLSTLKNHVPPGNWCIVFCYDGERSKEARQAIMPAYKAHRSVDRFNPLPEMKEVLQYIPGIHVESPICEGDDGIAWSVAAMGNPKRPCVVLSGDKDLWTLMRFPWVKVHSPNFKRLVTIEDIRKNYHVDDPSRITFAKALFGDNSDGIKSVNRLLKKQVEPHLNAMELNSLEHFMSLVEAADPQTTSEKTKEKLREAQQQIKDNLAVISANTTDFNATTVKRTIAHPENRRALVKALLEYDCKTMVNRVDDFFGAEFYVQEAIGDD